MAKRQINDSQHREMAKRQINDSEYREMVRKGYVLSLSARFGDFGLAERAPLRHVPKAHGFQKTGTALLENVCRIDGPRAAVPE
jgi:hypothetical protein